MSEIYLIRHGQAAFGTDDYDRLSELGAEQSRLAGDWFKRRDITIHHAMAGGLKRHIQTAEAFFAGYGEPPGGAAIERDPDFNEIDQGDIINPTRTRTGAPVKLGTASKSFAEFRAMYEPAFMRWTSGAYDHEYAEPLPLVDQRFADAIARVAARLAPEQTAAVFTSGGTIGMILRRMLGLSDVATSDLMWTIGNTSMTLLRWEHEGFVVKFVNSLAHLECRNEPRLLTLT